MDEMVLAEVTDTEDLSITEACRRFPREARACKLRRMAKRWRGGKVRCIVLSNARPAPEYINLSAGCLGLASQFVGKSGVPRFCHKWDLHKTVAVKLSEGQVVHQRLVRSWPLIACPKSCRKLGQEQGGGKTEEGIKKATGPLDFYFTPGGGKAPGPSGTSAATKDVGSNEGAGGKGPPSAARKVPGAKRSRQHMDP